MKKQLFRLLSSLIILLLFLPMQTFAEVSSKRYNIKVYLGNQNVEIFRDGQLIKKIPCSTGINPGTTIPGKFKTYLQKEKDVWKEADGSEVNYYYITSINEKNAFHSMIEGNHPLVEEGKKLFAERKPSSMGCIRLRKEDAEWIYHLPLGVSVEVIGDYKARITEERVKINNNKIISHVKKADNQTIKAETQTIDDPSTDETSSEYFPRSLERYLMQ
jgi:hypothetical protein